MVTGREVKILDFGLARFDHAAGSTCSSDRVSDEFPTREGQVLGTPAYMSPEQAQGEPTQATSDVFSWGACAFEVLTGRAAFTRASAVQTMMAVVSWTPPRSALDEAGVPPAVGALVLRSLEKDPAQRYADGGALLDELRRARSSMPARPRRWVVPGALALTVVTGVALAAYVHRPRAAREGQAPPAQARPVTPALPPPPPPTLEAAPTPAPETVAPERPARRDTSRRAAATARGLEQTPSSRAL